jgi:electron transport complex protein RnfE
VGITPAIAVTNTFINAIGMGICTAAVLIISNLVMSLVRKIIPVQIRFAVSLVVVAGLVTLADMMLKAYFPSLSQNLGIFVPLITVNCMILSRAEIFAAKNDWLSSLLDGIGMGLGFLLALALIGSMREILGNGTFAGMAVFGTNYQPALMMSLPAGGFILLGLLTGLVQACKRDKQSPISEKQ